MIDDTFFNVNAVQPEDPLSALKQKVNTLSQKSPNDPTAKYLKQFIDFAEKTLNSGSLDYLLMSNSGESEMAAGTILLTLGTSQKLADEAVPELYNNLYLGYKASSATIEDVHFSYTRIPRIWEWWEKGETEEMPFGTVENDKLVGFIRVGGFDKVN